MKSASLLILTVVFVLVLCGAASAGTPLAVNQTGTVSGDLYVNTTDGWPSSTQDATNEVTQANTLPTYTSIDSAWVYVNVYSGSGTNNWPVRTTVKIDANGDGDYDDAGELLGTEDMNIPGTTDGTVYWLNDHCNRVYSDYQVWYNVTGLITSNNPTLYVKTENMGGDGYDGRIKLLALCVAYNDGDTDKVDYWVLNGQDWINTATSPSTSTFNTSSFTGQVSNATLNTVALSGTDGSYTLNGNTLSDNLTETGSYYKEHQWDLTSNINSGANTNLTYANVGSSFKINLATLTIREAAALPPVADFTANVTSILRNSAVQFTSNSTGTIDSYAWDFNNDGTTDSTLQNPTYTYTTPGTYTVKLIVTGPAGTDTKTITDYITVNPKTWYVNDNGGTGIDYTNIQTAINNAVSYDTIYVYAGTYLGFNVNIPYLTIVGESADLVTVTKNSAGQYNKIRLSDGSSANGTGTILQGMTLSVRNLYIGTFGPAPNSTVKNCIINLTVSTDIGQYYDTSNLTFEGNLVNYGAQNYYLAFYGASSKIINNRFNGAVILRDSADSSIFRNNTIENYTGTYLPILMIDSSDCNISDNTFRNNTGTVIRIDNTATNNTITRNIFNGNGVVIDFNSAGNNNNIYLNNFINNTSLVILTGTAPTINWSSPEQINYTYNNHTYTGYMGNYYSNYAGEDANHDGIGDTPYTLPNGLGVDNYPLMATWDQYFDVQAPTVTANPAGGNLATPTQVTLTATDNTDPNPVIYYTTDGRNPTSSSTMYTGPINIIQPTTLKFIGIDASGNTSTIQSEIYTDAQAPTVTAKPVSGTYTSLTQVSLSATDNFDPNPKIYYTLNGTDPTTTSTQYTNPINIIKTTLLKFIAVDASGNISPVQSETYTINDSQAPTVTANPTSETFNPPLQVTLSATDDVDINPIIYYTTDGTDPTTTSTLYTGPISLTATTTLKFIAVDASGNISSVQIETYTMVDTEAPNVTATQSGTTVTLSATDNSNTTPTIYYTTDETDPNTSSTPYNGPITIPQYATTIVKFIAVDASGNTSPVQSKTYTTYTGDPWNGGRYYNGKDLETQYYAEGNIGVVVDNGGTGYGGGNPVYNLSLPADATIVAAHLCLAWTWYGYGPYTVSFNGNTIASPIAHYEDALDGQDVYDVTPYFNTTGTNTAIIGGGGGANYGRTSVVIYQSASEPYRQIWLNEGYDVLYNPPATGYAIFNNVTTDKVTSAQIMTILPSGQGDGTTILFNGQNINENGSGGSDPQFYYFDVTTALKNGTNEMGTWGGTYFALQNAILTVTQATTPVADFTTTAISGAAPLQVQFTDTSTNTPTSWLWEYDSGSDWTTFASGTDSAAENPLYTFTIPGTYSIRLTATNVAGSDDEVKTGFITVKPAITNPRTGQIYASIQDAINDALTLSGDTLTLQEGTYTENITTSKQLTLNTAGAVTIQAANVDLPVFTVEIAGSGSTINGFTITGATNSCGINLDFADDCNITGNVIGGNLIGVKFFNSNNNNLSGNTIQNNTWAGICLDLSTGETINANVVSGNQEGLFLANSSTGNTITGNNIHDNTGTGVNILSNSNQNTIQNNTVSSNGVMGLLVQNSNTNTISGNTVQNNGWAGIVLDQATGNTINNGNEVSGSHEGIFLANNSNNNIITGNNIHNNIGVGVSVLNSNSNQILSNTASANGVMGIFIQNSNTNTLSGNTVQNNGWAGICLDQATSNTINSLNVVTGNQEGIFLANNSGSNTIENNQVNSNTGNGISILNSNSNTINTNQLNNNGISGMFIQNSTGTVIYHNTLESNWGGVVLDTTSSTIVHQNNFINNAEQALAANGTGNKFYQGTTGNYYNDWTTTQRRIIDGNENTYDHYPKTTPF